MQGTHSLKSEASAVKSSSVDLDSFCDIPEFLLLGHEPPNSPCVDLQRRVQNQQILLRDLGVDLEEAERALVAATHDLCQIQRLESRLLSDDGNVNPDCLEEYSSLLANATMIKRAELENLLLADESLDRMKCIYLHALENTSLKRWVSRMRLFDRCEHPCGVISLFSFEHQPPKVRESVISRKEQVYPYEDKTATRKRAASSTSPKRFFPPPPLESNIHNFFKQYAP